MFIIGLVGILVGAAFFSRWFTVNWNFEQPVLIWLLLPPILLLLIQTCLLIIGITMLKKWGYQVKCKKLLLFIGFFILMAALPIISFHTN